jgi:hypothetical protein
MEFAESKSFSQYHPWHGNCLCLNALNSGLPERLPMSEVRINENMVDEKRAAVLLGLALPELRWFSRLLGLGHKEETGEVSHVVFTYEELKRLSSTAAASAK